MLIHPPSLPMRRVPGVLAAAVGLLLFASTGFAQTGEIDLPGHGGEIDRPGRPGEVEPPSRPDVSNPKNAYDEAGRLHNEGLEYAVSARHKIGPWRGPLSIAVTGRILELWASDDPTSCAVGPADVERVAQFIAADPETRYALLKEVMPEEHLAWVERIRALMHVDDPEGTAEELKKLEDEIRATLPEKEARSLLATASIARYSTEYWHRQGILGEKSLWDLGDGNPSQKPDVNEVDMMVYKYEFERALQWLHYPSAHAYALHMSMLASAGLAISKVQYQ